MKISACIITNDNLEVCKAIASVQDSCFEIILVHTSKPSQELLSALNQFKTLKQFKMNWCDDFSAVRNFGISKATGDWILIIDSDEVLKDKIETLDNVYDYVLASIELGNTSYWNHRLFKNGIGIKYQNRIHETIEFNVEGLKGVKSDIKFIHSGYEGTKEEMDKRIERNFRLLLKDKNNPHKHFHFSRHYFAVEDWQKAIKHGLLAIKQPNMNNENKALICAHLYRAYHNTGLGDYGLFYLKKSIELLPLQILARYLIVNYFFALQDLRKYKEIILEQLNVIGSVITYKNSEMPNELYLDINFINQKIKEIQKWQQA